MASASCDSTQRRHLKVCENEALGLPFPSLGGQGWDGLHKEGIYQEASWLPGGPDQQLWSHPGT